MRYLLLFLLLSWTAQASAFFCLSSDKNHHNRRQPPRLARMIPPPAYFHVSLPYRPMSRPYPPVSETKDLPSIVSTRPAPEMIDGYRFRPIRHKALTENDRSARRVMEK